jgi:hypothetical protein
VLALFIVLHCIVAFCSSTLCWLAVRARADLLQTSVHMYALFSLRLQASVSTATSFRSVVHCALHHACSGAVACNVQAVRLSTEWEVRC